MLTLTRKVGETIRIGDDIEIVVKEIRKNQVRIGLVAPREVKIYREEVYDNILADNLHDLHTDWCTRCGAEHSYMSGDCACGGSTFTKDRAVAKRFAESR
jgi:carbon storage regulator